MPVTPEDYHKIRTDVEVLKSESTQVLKAIGEGTAQTKENNVLINRLINKMDSHDIRLEFEAKERDEERAYVRKIETKVDTVNLRLDNMMPVYQKSKISQESKQKFYDSINSTWGKMAGALIVIAIATALGLDLSSILK